MVRDLSIGSTPKMIGKQEKKSSYEEGNHGNKKLNFSTSQRSLAHASTPSAHFLEPS